MSKQICPERMQIEILFAETGDSLEAAFVIKAVNMKKIFRSYCRKQEIETAN